MSTCVIEHKNEVPFEVQEMILDHDPEFYGLDACFHLAGKSMIDYMSRLAKVLNEINLSAKYEQEIRVWLRTDDRGTYYLEHNPCSIDEPWFVKEY